MNDCRFTFRSITAAMQGRELLQKGGVTATMLRAPLELRESGCSYTLRVAQKDLYRARELLERSARPYRRVACRDAEGKWRAEE